jgi:hypothetical protein
VLDFVSAETFVGTAPKESFYQGIKSQLHSPFSSTWEKELWLSTKPTLYAVLEQYEVSCDRFLWDCHVQYFMNEVNALYPIVNPHSLQTRCMEILEQCHTSELAYIPDNVFDKTQIAKTLICLALGENSNAVESHCGTGSCAGGWNLYRAAAFLLGDLLECLISCDRPLLKLQTLVLMV